MKNPTQHIVLVEDEEVIASILTKKLQQEGYDVSNAYDGVTGLELIHSKKPDLVLLDMMLPRLSGFEILEKLNEEKILPQLPVIIISNSGQPIEIDRALKLGIRDYLIKVNFDPNEIVMKVKLVFNANANKKDIVAGNHKKLPNILIVEDDKFLTGLLRRKLEHANMNAFQAFDTEQAQQILESNSIDVILLDVLLPGTDGITFLKKLKIQSGLKLIPVIIISNLGQTDEIEKGIQAGATSYLIKANTTPEEIVARVHTLISPM